MNPITTILADDAALVRSTIAQLLALEPDISVLGEYADGTSALAAIAELRPHVAVLDVDMPGMDGIEVAEAVAAQHTSTRVLILSSITASGTYHAAMRAGVWGYISKTAPSYRLADAVRAVSAGGRRRRHAPDPARAEDPQRLLDRPVDPRDLRVPRPVLGDRRAGDEHAARQDRRPGPARGRAHRFRQGLDLTAPQGPEQARQV
jgi:two-component system response regulator DesR